MSKNGFPIEYFREELLAAVSHTCGGLRDIANMCRWANGSIPQDGICPNSDEKALSGTPLEIAAQMLEICRRCARSSK